MSTTKVILAGAAGAAAVGAVLLWRRTQQAKEQGGSFCASVAQPLARMAEFDIPPSVCGIVDRIAGAVADAVKDGVTHADEDAKNKELNGEVDIPLTDQLRAMTSNGGDNNLDNGAVYYKAGTVLRFKNGCTPFEGSSGWSKCAPGTETMARSRGWVVRPKAMTVKAMTAAELQERAVATIDWSQLLTAGPRDPATLLEPFPDGSYIIAGKRYTCPAGQEPSVQRVTDHRTGQTTVKVTCGAPYERTEWTDAQRAAVEEQNRKGSPTSSTSGGGDVNDPSTWPPGYRWNGSHWERA